MVQSLPGFLNLSLKVCSPCQVLGDVYTEVLEAAHPLHRGPTDHKRSAGPLLSLPEVHDQLFSFSHVQRELLYVNNLYVHYYMYIIYMFCRKRLPQSIHLFILTHRSSGSILIPRFSSPYSSIKDSIGSIGFQVTGSRTKE